MQWAKRGGKVRAGLSEQSSKRGESESQEDPKKVEPRCRGSETSVHEYTPCPKASQRTRVAPSSGE